MEERQEIRSIRLLAETPGGPVRRVGKLAFGDDASFYILPGMVSPRHYFDVEKMPEEPIYRGTPLSVRCGPHLRHGRTTCDE